MRVLVTGHLGYIGACLVPALEAANFDVVGSDPDLYRRCNYAGEPGTIRNLGKDIRDLRVQDLEGFDVLVHLAGLCNDPLGELDPALTAEINYQATARLGQLARDAGAHRFVFASSCSNYGAAGEDFIDETAALNPVTAYGRSKVNAEAALSQLADSSFSPVYLRCATVYGYSPRIRFDLVVNNLVAWAHTTGRVLLKSQGLAWRPLVHVEDVAAAFVAAIQAPREQVHDEPFNIGLTEENFRVRELAQMIAVAMPDTRVEMVPGALADKRTYRVNCDKARATLSHWRPRWTVKGGIDSLAHVYRKHGLEQPDFEGPRYQRVAHLRHLLASACVGPDFRVAEGGR